MRAAPRSTIQSLGRALRLLQQFSPSHPEWSVGELAAAAGLPKGTVSKILATFQEHGYLIQDPVTRRYRLGPALLVAGRMAENGLDIARLALPLLRRVTEASGETSILMVQAGWRSICLAKVDSPHPVRMAAEVGRFASLHSGASNKPILAYLPEEAIDAYLRSPYFVRRGPRTITDREQLLANLAEIRRRGYSESDSEVEVDIQAFGAAVFDAYGWVTGAISIAGPRQRLAHRPASAMVAAVQDAARELSRLLGWQGTWPAPWPPARPGQRRRASNPSLP
ncbi:IclR family transcriptional regulator [Thermaerobacter subterraneus]|uniref:Glycerol operon regulatory protein n=1 Tax=Thermaerobacter subterraneus DSM 13965 TaxID=867903 RepID=K6P3K6_9FIRM|nr:IclR family transcriptional regulator [Thermaerobacter subterraneus]EKP95630.1 transcriptional regulator [Thermaerobacter subterraneus DSM 13965]